MRKILLSLVLAATAFAQTNVQKGAGNVLSNGSIVVGSNTSITATGTGNIIATGGTASSLPWAGLTAIPSPTLSLAGDGTAAITLSASTGVTGNLTLATVNSNTGTFAGITLNGKGLATAASALTISTTAPLTGGGTLGNLTLAIPAATGSVNGYLTSTDWTTFNSKQAAGSYITALTGDGTAAGPGSSALTLATVATAGTTGSSTAIPVVTINAKGLTTGITTAAVVAPAGTLTGTTLASNVVTSSLTSVGTLTGLTTGTLIGTSSTNAFNVAAGVTPFTEMEVDSTVTTSPRGIMTAQFNTGTDGARLHFRKARGTRASPTTIVSGDNLGRLVGTGYDGSSYLEDASIIFGTEGTVASTRIPTNISFWTATDAAPSVLTLAGTINSAQKWTIPGVFNVTATTASTSTTTGSLINAGGFGNAGAAFFGNLIDVAGNTTIRGTGVSSVAGSFGVGTTTPLTWGQLSVRSAVTGIITSFGVSGSFSDGTNSTLSLINGATNKAGVYSDGDLLLGSSNTLALTIAKTTQVATFAASTIVRGGNANSGSSTSQILSRISGTVPSLQFVNSTGSTDTHIWDVQLLDTTNVFQMRKVNDAFSTANVWLEVTPSGNTISSVAIKAGSGTTAATFTSTTTTLAGNLTTPGGATFHTTSTALTDGAGVALGTLATAPTAGNPTKWIGINDNGTTRYIPAW